MKIALYAICKNEEKFIFNWLINALSTDIDYICVLDTGSTDETYNILTDWAKMYPDRIKVAQKIITPWRFDVARNESMNLIPDDADWWLCTDIDEQIDISALKPLIEEAQKHSFVTINTIYYLYNWGDDRIFWYDKLHRNGVAGKWVGAVHEAFTPDVPELATGTIDKILVSHHPDPEKSRSYYLDLLKVRADENPDDIMSWAYLMLEYTYHQDWSAALKIIRTHLLNYARDHTSSELAKYIWFWAGKCYRNLGNNILALHYFMLSGAHDCYEARLERMEIFIELIDYRKARRELNALITMIDDGIKPTHFWMELVNSHTYGFGERLSEAISEIMQI